MEEKIRLAVFGQKRLSREGGIEIVVKELCTRMAQNGCDITCYNRAAISVCPSEWYENCPYSVMESVLLGTPVVGSKMGGIPELIEPGKTGELFEAGNVEELMKAIKKVLQTQDVLERYTKNCSQVKYETTESYYIKLMKIYRGEKNVEQISS